MNRLREDELLQAVVMIAELDGVSIKEVASRGTDDLALRLARIARLAEKRNANG